MDGKTPGAAAEREAWEEAGVRGKVSESCLGAYAYEKVKPGDDVVPCLAMLYPLKVKTLHRKYPESKQRQRKWVSRKKAAKLVDAPDLAGLILDFDPGAHKRRT